MKVMVTVTYLCATTLATAAIWVVQIPLFLLISSKSSLALDPPLLTDCNLLQFVASIMAAVLLAARLWYVCEWPDTNPVMIFLVAIDLAFGIAAAVRFTVKYPNAEQLQSRWAVYSNRFTPHQAAKHFYGGLWAVMAFTSFILFCEISRWAYRSYRQMLKDRRNSQAPLKLDRLSRPMAGGHLEPTQRQSVLQDVAAV